MVPVSTALFSGALVGFADGSSYDKHRPSYPPEAVDYLLKSTNLSGQSGFRVVDLAAGTGKFTELLATRSEQFDIVAVEPHDGMRSELENKNLSKVVVKKGFATDIPLDDAWANGLICAQVSVYLIPQNTVSDSSK
jgi:trans-aconitate methyltransferase